MRRLKWGEGENGRMMRGGTLLKGLLVVGVIFGLGWGVLGGLGPSGVRKTGDEPVSEDVSPERATLRLRGIRLEEFERDRRRLEVAAGEASFLRRKGKLLLERVMIRWPLSNGEAEEGFVLKGEKVVYDFSARIAVISGSVVMKDGEGHIFETEMARYDDRKRRVEAPGAVRMEGPDGLTEGTGLQVDLKEERFLLQEKVRTIILPEAMKRAEEVLPR